MTPAVPGEAVVVVRPEREPPTLSDQSTGTIQQGAKVEGMALWEPTLGQTIGSWHPVLLPWGRARWPLEAALAAGPGQQLSS